MYTPDSLSREGSPIPEDEMPQQMIVQQQQQLTLASAAAAQRSQPMLPPSAEELRLNQSTTANNVLQGLFSL